MSEEAQPATEPPKTKLPAPPGLPHLHEAQRLHEAGQRHDALRAATDAIDSALEVLNYLPHDPILAAALDPAVQQDQDEAAQGQPEVAQTRGIEVTPMQRANLMLVDEALFLSASVRLEHGQPTLALAYACLMEHYTNDNKRARVVKARALMELEQYELATRELLTLPFDVMGTHLREALIRRMKQREHGLDEHELPWEDVKNKGNDAFKSKSYKTAVRLYTQALAQLPPSKRESQSIVLSNRALAHLYQHEDYDALADACISIALNPRNIKAWLRKARALRSLGHILVAKYAYEHTAEMRPSDPPPEVARALEAIADELSGKQ